MSEAEIADLLEKGHQPGLVLVKTRKPKDPGLPGCWFGGLPTLPAHVDWPIYDAAEDEPSVPMHFVCQINLAQVPEFEGRPEMPTSGTLFFFVDPIFAPVYSIPKGGGRVIYVADDVSGCPERAVPDGLPLDPDNEDVFRMSGTYKDNPTDRFPRWNFTFVRIDGVTGAVSPNNHFDHAKAGRLSAAWKAVTKATADLRGEYVDRPDNVAPEIAEYFAQHSMFMGTDLPWFADHWDRHVTIPLETARASYFPLLVVDYDPDLLFGFGNGDKAKFWISRDDLARGDFNNMFLLGGT